MHSLVQQEKLTECNIPPEGPTSKTSPDWSVGYKLSTHTEGGTLHEGPFFWWDGWMEEYIVTIIHIHLKNGGFTFKLSFNEDIVYDKCYWEKINQEEEFNNKRSPGYTRNLLTLANLLLFLSQKYNTLALR